MQRVEELLALQRQKRDLFAALEVNTHRLLSCLEEEIPQIMQERESLIREIDQATEQMTQQAQEVPGFLQAASNQAQQDTLSPPLREAYDIGLEMRALVGRIMELSTQAQLRMESCRDQILEKIKSVNSGAMARASKYHQQTVRPSSFQSEG